MRMFTTKKRTRTLALVSILSVVLVPAIALGAAAPADAMTVAPGVPGPVNVLPSTVIGATSSATRPEVLALILAKMMKDPTVIAAVRAKEAAAAGGPAITSAQAATLAEEASTFAVPATKALTLAKVVGTTNVAVGGFAFGLMIGDGAARMLGFKDSDVCTQDNGVLKAVAAVTNNVNCAAYDEMIAQQVQNIESQGAFPGVGTQVCAAGVCATITAVVDDVFKQSGQTNHRWCFQYTATGTLTGFSLRDAAGASIGPSSIVNVTCTHGANDGGGNSTWTAATPPAGSIQGQNTLSANALTPVAKIRLQVGATVSDAVPVPVATNPQRTFRCVLVGTSGQTYTKDSAGFFETDPTYKDISCPTLPSSDTLAHMTVRETTGGGTGSVLYDQDTTPQYQAFKGAYPECGSGTCLLDLRTAAGVSCFTVPGPCADWFADPAKASNYACFYGTHSVGLNECTLYAPTFKPDATSSGNVVADPRTGETPGVKTAPSEDSGAQNKPADGADQRTECFPTGWGIFNPFGWVFQPVQCALNWAFVPRASKVTEAEQTMQQKWTASGPFKAMQAIAAMAAVMPTATGCDGPHVVIDVGFWHGSSIPFVSGLPPIHYDGYPMSACADPGAWLASLAKTIGDAVMLWFATLAVIRNVVSIVGAKSLN